MKTKVNYAFEDIYNANKQGQLAFYMYRMYPAFYFRLLSFIKLYTVHI